MLKSLFLCYLGAGVFFMGCGSSASSSGDGYIGMSKTDQCNAVVDRINTGLKFEGRPATAPDQQANETKKDADSYRKLAASIGEMKIIHPDLKGVADEYVKVLGTAAEASDALATALTSLDEANIAAAEKKVDAYVESEKKAGGRLNSICAG